MRTSSDHINFYLLNYEEIYKIVLQWYLFLDGSHKA